MCGSIIQAGQGESLKEDEDEVGEALLEDEAEAAEAIFEDEADEVSAESTTFVDAQSAMLDALVDLVAHSGVPTLSDDALTALSTPQPTSSKLISKCTPVTFVSPSGIEFDLGSTPTFTTASPVEIPRRSALLFY